jgi:hypothetical protein
MATYKDRVVKSVTRYEPGSPPENPEDMGIYVVNELKRLANVVLNQSIFRLERTHVAPDRPRGGDIRYADGTNWNPGGTGEGIYFFKESTTAWVKL